MREFNTYWISSVARTGSMWITNVIKEIFISKDFSVFPKKNIKSDADFVNLYKTKALLDKNETNKYVLKVHSKIKSIPPGSKVITTKRNPYDICASYKEFMKCNLSLSIESALLLADFLSHYKQISKNVFIVKYDDIETQPHTLINELALFCNLKLSSSQIKNIAEKYDKENVKSLIKINDQKLKEAIAENQELNEQKIVKDGNGNIRSFDIYTGFQSGHISSRKTGDWKKIFSEEEIEIIIEKIDPIAIELGYASERN